MCPRMQTPGGGVWAGTPPCGKTPPGPALHLNGRRDRRPLAERARAQGAPADLPRLDRCSPAGHLEGLQAEGARPRRICRDTAKESRPAGRTPGHQQPASSRAQLDTSTRGALPLRIWANGHTSACAPVPAPAQDLPGRTGPALPPQQGKGRRRHGPARPAGHLNAWADPAAIVSAAASQRHPWTRGAGAPAGHLNADSWRGTKKAPNPQKWCVIWCVKTLTC